MERIDPSTLTNIILTAPRWAQTGLAHGGIQREQAAEVLARTILQEIAEAAPDADPNQLGLAL